MEVPLRSERTQTPETMDMFPIPSEPAGDEALDDDVLDGPTFPLKSKRLNAARIRRIAGALDVPTGAAADEVCQMLGEKLRSMGHDSANVQVIIQGNSNLYLVDDTGVIKCVMGNVDDHVDAHVTEEITSTRLRSVLREAKAENESLANELATARQELLEAKSLIAELKEEAASLVGANSELQSASGSRSVTSC